MVMTNLGEKIVRIYDDILSGLVHISSLNINRENVKKFLDYSSNKEYEVDPDIKSGHDRFIGEVVISSQESDISSIRKFILYPDFSVKSYIPNREFYYTNSSSLEKSLLMGLKQEINFVINDPRFRPKDNLRNIMVLSIEKVSFSFDTDYYRVSFKTIPSGLFYEYYARLVAPYKVYRQINNEDYIKFKSLAVRDVLNILGDVKENLEGEFTLKKSDYNKLKEYLKNKYGIEYSDEYKSIIGEITSIWNNLGIARYDNRILGIKNGDAEPIPLLYQRNNELIKKNRH